MREAVVFRGAVVLGCLFVARAVAAPTAYQFEGSAGELVFPAAPLTVAEGQELSQKFAGEASVTLVWDGAAATAQGGGQFHYAPASGTVLELTVTNAAGTSTYSFSEYLVFVDDAAQIDTIVVTPFLLHDASATLTTTTDVNLDIGIVFQDATSATLTSTSALPATLDFTKLDARDYGVLFLDPDTSNAIGRIDGALVPSP